MPGKTEKKNRKTARSDADADSGAVKLGNSPGKELAVIGDEDTVIGFGLTGIKHLLTIEDDYDDKDIIISIKELIETPNVGFIIITQTIAERIRTDFERLKLEKPLYPIIIELPDKRGELPDHVDPIRNLIRRAIGMEVIKGGT
jgi:V/A-type H+-transporting ATPase subunit F